jgi:MFS family permease
VAGGVGGAFSSVVGRIGAAARAGGADRSGLTGLMSVHALHNAGDALVAVSLAGTLFFSVPLGQARDRVALYLLLTLLPFSLLVPVAGPLLDRLRHGRRVVLAASTGGRAIACWLMAATVDDLRLYPLALVVLVLSRGYGVARSAAVPRVRPPGLGLVQTGARLNLAAVAGGTVAAGIGAGLIALAGPAWSLRLAALVLLPAAVLAMRLPSRVDDTRVPVRPDDIAPGRYRLGEAGPEVRPSLVAAVALRALSGFLLVYLAFLLREQGASGTAVGLVVGAAAIGQFAGTAVSSQLSEEHSRVLPWVGLSVPLVLAVLAFLQPEPVPRMLLVIAAGAAASVAKFALDAALQTSVPPSQVSTAFARSETALQLAFAVGGGLALLLPVADRIGYATALVLPAIGLVLAHRARTERGEDEPRGYREAKD